MAKEFPQFQEERSTFRPQHVTGSAEGHEAFAKVLGGISSAATSKVEEMVTEQSQTMYINSVANIEQLKTGAQIRLLESPNDASKISEQTKSAIDLVGKTAYVNSKDRTKLNAYISGAVDDVELKATTTEIRQRQNEALFTHYVNWPDQLKAYQTALLTGDNKAEDLKSAMISSLHGMVQTGVMTPHQAASSIQTMTETVKVAEDYHRALNSANLTAQDYHTLSSNPLINRSSEVGAPVNQSTAWMTSYYSGDKSYQGVLSDISNRRFPSMEAFTNLTEPQRNHAIMAIQGVQIADGMINSGEPFPVIEDAYKRLSTKGSVLNYREQATRDALGSYVNQLKNGNFLDLMGKTPLGNSIFRDFNDRNNAILNSATTDEKKREALIQNKNNLVNHAVSYADGNHIPREYVQPIPKADVVTTQNAFKQGQDPSTILNTLAQYSKPNQVYLANAMEKPEQRVIVQAAGLLENDLSYQDKLDFIAANQDGNKFISKGIEKDEKDKVIETQIYTKLKEPLRFIQQNYDAEQANRLQTAMIDTTMNAFKYIAQKDNNPTLENKGLFEGGLFNPNTVEKYINQATAFYTKAYQQESGANWVVNKKQLPTPLTNSELDSLAEWAITNGNDLISSHLGETRYNQMMGRNALKMIITPANDVQAVTANGDVVFSVPYNSNLIPHIQQEMKKRKEVEDERKRKSVLESAERTQKKLLHVRLPEDANSIQ